MRCQHLEGMFDHLGEHDYDHNDVSPAVPTYNCIAWAAGENHRRWWPADWDRVTYYWPNHLPRQPFGMETLKNFVDAFKSLGYTKRTNSRSEDGIEKIAIFLNSNNVPTHAARQLESGEWASKCGVRWEDIKHKTLYAVEGREYGKAVKYLKRRRDGKPFLTDRIGAIFKRLFVGA